MERMRGFSERTRTLIRNWPSFAFVFGAMLLCSATFPIPRPPCEAMTNADVVKELMLLKDSGHPVSAMVVLYAGMVNVKPFDRPAFAARDAALTLLTMVKGGLESGER